jgi:hypothetical protein
VGRTYQAISNLIDDAIADGTLDAEDLSQLGSHIWECRQELQRRAGRKVAATLAPGAQVRIRHDAHLRPRYILGTLAEVVKINQTTATIVLGEVRGGSRFSTGQEIRCPLDALELEPDSRPKETS